MTKRSFNKDKLVRLAKANQIVILKALGFQKISEIGIQQICPVHLGNNPSAFSYHLSKNCWSCFTHHCEEKYGNDIIGLVRAIKKSSFIEALQWIGQVLKNENVDSNLDIAFIESKIDIITDIPDQNLIIEESRLNNLIDIQDYMLNRGFKLEVLKHFEGGICSNKNPIHNRYMIPVRNFDGQLIGFTGRSLYEMCPECKSFHDHKELCPTKYQGLFSKWRNYGFKKALVLYNIHNAISTIKKVRECILVEGVLDVWSLWQSKIKNAVAPFGTSLSFEQMLLLAQSGCVDLKIMFDGDTAGKNGANRIAKASNRYFNVEIVDCPEGEDPCVSILKDRSKEH